MAKYKLYEYNKMQGHSTKSMPEGSYISHSQKLNILRKFGAQINKE